jgi:hypothetical protein
LADYSVALVQTVCWLNKTSPCLIYGEKGQELGVALDKKPIVIYSHVKK